MFDAVELNAIWEAVRKADYTEQLRAVQMNILAKISRSLIVKSEDVSPEPVDPNYKSTARGTWVQPKEEPKNEKK